MVTTIVRGGASRRLTPRIQGIQEGAAARLRSRGRVSRGGLDASGDSCVWESVVRNWLDRWRVLGLSGMGDAQNFTMRQIRGGARDLRTRCRRWLGGGFLRHASV